MVVKNGKSNQTQKVKITEGIVKMNKEKRLKSNGYYSFVNLNPKGRFVGDCVVRAIALACNQTWEKTLRELTELGIKKGAVLNDKKLFPLYLKQKGFTQEKEPRELNHKMTIRDWIDYDASYESGFRKKAYVILAGAHHLTCVKDGVVNDTWDCSKETMHRYWWIKID